MKPIIVSSLILLGGFAGAALADCTTNPPLTDSEIATAVSGQLVCGRPGPGFPGGASSADRWQEEHLVGGQLWDYKLGPGDPIDPRKQVGSWSIASNKITHSYIGGAAYTWDLRPIAVGTTGGRYSFCIGSAEHVIAVIRPNAGTGCMGAFP